MAQHKIVIARYKEDLDWIVDIPSEFQVVIYNKGNAISDGDILSRASEIVARKNTGRESETYLHHMLNHTGDDDAFTVFTQGDPFEHNPDFVDFLRHWGKWSDVQGLAFQWRPSAAIPPSLLLGPDERSIEKVRYERFSLSTWGPIDFVDPNAIKISVTYRSLHNLQPGTNIAGHFLEICDMFEASGDAKAHSIGLFSYGAVFAVKNRILSRVEKRSIMTMMNLVNSHPVYGYIMERMWLHIMGVAFVLPRNGAIISKAA